MPRLQRGGRRFESAPAHRPPARIAFATHEQLPAGSPDDLRTLPALAAAGVVAEPAVWSDPNVRWEEYDAVVIRSTWDYHRRPEAFQAWLARASGRTRVWNPPTLVRWNAHKGYLLDLAARGEAVVPTELLRAGTRRTLATVRRERGWSSVVLKPAIGADAEGLRVVEGEVRRADEEHLRALLAAGDALVQPLLARVRRDGERSMIFLGGAYSHAAAHPFVLGGAPRVGTPVSPEPDLLARAERLVRRLAPEPLYARLDLLPDDDGGWLVSELELIEPDLFLRVDPAAPARFAAAIIARLPTTDRAARARGGLTRSRRAATAPAASGRRTGRGTPPRTPAGSRRSR